MVTETWSAQHLRAVPIAQRRDLLPQHLRDLVDRAAKEIRPKQILIFGSRSRGNARPNSDFDIAFESPHAADWPRFVFEISDSLPSLYSYDFVNMDEIDSTFREKILAEGIVLTKIESE